MASLFIPPALLLTVLLSLLYGSLFHLYQGKTWRQLGLALLTALLGFGVGQVLGAWSDWPLPTLGETRLVEGTAICWLFLIIARRWKLW